MPLDGVTISAVVSELRDKLLDGRIDKVTQPEADEIILAIRAKGVNSKLLITASASQPRLHLTQLAKDNPFTPPMFCMVMRKHLIGGKILDISQPGFDRIVSISIESMDEMRDLSVKRLIVEIMGKYSNIILTDDSGTILEAIKHISFDKSSVRQVLPGLKYAEAPGGKLNPLDASQESFYQLFDDNQHGAAVRSILFKSFNGICPMMAADICNQAEAPEFVGELTGSQKDALWRAFSQLMERVRGGRYINRIFFGADGKPADFTAVPVLKYAQFDCRPFDSPSEMVETYTHERDAAYRIAQKTADLRHLVQQNIERCARKAEIHSRTMAEVEGREADRIRGELLTANIYSLKKGMDSVALVNFYDPEQRELTIPMDPNLTPSENAQKYFKRYNKAKRAYIAVQEQIKQNDEDLEYLSSVQNAVDAAENEGDIAEIRAELIETGFAKRHGAASKQRIKRSKPLHYVSSDGFDIYVGKNNHQNDELTLRFAGPNDLWLHTKKIPGSHVIIKTDNKPVTDTAIQEAALLAAYYSKARGSSQVPVDYTPKKFVKKPNGAKPGMVIYETNKTAYMTPDEGAVKRITQLA